MQAKLSFCEEDPKRENIDKNNDQNQTDELHFTGNWFIDAGILGFVNLMEEVYGWNLETLQQKIKSNPNKVYYGYFPIAFVYCSYKEAKEEELTKPSEKDLDKRFCKISSQDEIFKEAWEVIKNNYSEKGRIELHAKGRWYFFHNFLFFQPKRMEGEQKNNFLEVLWINEPQEEVLVHMDRTLNKFLPSAEKFSNLSYTKSFIKTTNLEGLLPNLAFMLTFPLAFSDINNIKMLFYSPDIKFTYNVNKRLKVKLNKLNRDNDSVFRITWEAVLDSIAEMESLWSIENMYLIKYSRIKKQEILGVEYIGIPKLQASIILDDTIRDSLNKNIRLREAYKAYCWLLEEFITNKPLYPIVLQHVWCGISGELLKNKQYVSKTTCLYALAIDATIKYFNENNANRLFSTDFFNSYEWVIDRVKEDYNNMSKESYNMRDIFKDSNRKEVVYSLFSAIKSHNKKEFLYVMSKNLLNIKDSDKIPYIIEYLFEKILNNDICWENYALSLIVNIADN